MQVYFDNAATTPLLPEVKAKMIEIIEQQFGNPSSIHRLGREAKTTIERCRKSVANTFKSSIGEIFFTSGATESNNMIIRGAIHELGVKRIITTTVEHPCVHSTIAELGKNIRVDYLELDAMGSYSLDQLRDLLIADDSKTLVSLMHGNNELGNLADIQAIGELCKEHQALFHSDTAQTVGKEIIDLSQLNIDFFTGSGHKFHGPKGVGFVYINGENKLKPYLIGGNQERNMRSGTENVIGIVGLATALEQSINHRTEWQADIKTLKTKMLTGLQLINGDIRVNGKQTASLNHVLSLAFPPSANSDLFEINLDMAGIYASAGSACSSGTLKRSHVMDAIQLPEGWKPVRFSFSHLNTSEEIEYALEKIKPITK